MANGTAGSSDGANRIDDAPYAVAEPSQADEPVDETPALPGGTRLGGYRILRLLGRGGMGTVYSAENLMLQRRVAIKLLNPQRSGSGRAVQRFLFEARATARLNHPNVVGVYEVGTWSGGYFIAMELVRGSSADAFLEKRGPFDWREATRIVADVCRGLEAAHGLGLIHRDIKPANILRSTDGVVKLTDFGLAKSSVDTGARLTAETKIIGTPNYLSPEQALCKPLDGRSDLYSLGATYYHLAVGRAPFEREGSGLEVILAHIHEAPPDPRIHRPAIPEACAAIILKAMAKRPDDRYAAAHEMLADLEALLAADTAPAPAADQWSDFLSAVNSHSRTMTGSWSASALPAAPRRRGGRATVIAAILALVLISMGVGILLSRDRTAPEVRRMAAADAPAAEPAEPAITESPITPIEQFAAEPPQPIISSTDPLGAEFERLTTAASAAAADGNDRALGATVRDLLAFHDKHRAAADANHRAFGEQAKAMADNFIRPVSEKAVAGVVDLPHADGVEAVAFSPDGLLLASAGWDKTVRVWRGGPAGFAREPAFTLTGHAGTVRHLAFAPDSASIASVSEGLIRIWNVGDAKPRLVIDAHKSAWRVAFCDQGRSVLSFGLDGAVRKFDSADGSPRGIVKAPGPIVAAAVSLDGRTCVLGTDDGAVSRCDAASAATPARLGAVGDKPLAIAWSPEGSVAAAASAGEVKLFVAGAAERAGIGRAPVAFSPCGRVLATGLESGRNRWTVLQSVADGRELKRLPHIGEWMSSTAFSPDGRYLACAYWNGVRVWDLRLSRVDSSYPLGGVPLDAAWADEVVRFDNGDPPSKGSAAAVDRILGASDVPFLSLGRRGTVVLRFVGKALVDGPGDDLAIWEHGTAHGGGDEPTEVSISVDGSDWITVGRHRGGTSAVDISKVAKPGRRYAYVRLVDAGEASGGGAVGADIDAVQLLNCVPVSAFASAAKPLARVAPWLEIEADKAEPGPPTKPTVLRLDRDARITQIQTLHARGAAAGTLALRRRDGTVLGPWAGTLVPGADANVARVVHPDVLLPPGEYTVLDSTPATWIRAADGRGIAIAR